MQIEKVCAASGVTPFQSTTLVISSEPCLRVFVTSALPVPPFSLHVALPISVWIHAVLNPSSVIAYDPGIRLLHVNVAPSKSAVLQFGSFGYEGPVMQIENVWFSFGVTPFQFTVLVICSDPCLRVFVTPAEPVPPLDGT